VTTAAPIFIVPDSARQPLRVAAAGTILNVLKEEGDWIEVQFADPQWGPRTGWIEAKSIRISRPDLQPMDLSINHEPDSTPLRGDQAVPRTPDTTRTYKQPTNSPLSSNRGWFDVNMGAAVSGAPKGTFTFVAPLFQETTALASSYPKPSTGVDFDFGGGYMFSPRAGIGMSLTGTAHEDGVGLGITVPHPYFFNASDTDGAPTKDKLTRTEGAAHIQVMLVPTHSENLRLRVFGGPSYFRYKADMVQDVEYSQLAFQFSRLNSVVITGYNAEKVEGTGWGFHGGADVSWFFSRFVGVGGFARYARGSVSLDPEPLSEEQHDVTVGGFQSGGGLRFRF
jgi:hypothetical protein